MLVYIIILIILLLLAIGEQFLPEFPFLFGLYIGLALILIAGFRGEEVSRDYGNYLMIFSDVGSLSSYIKEYDKYFFYEPMFFLIIWVSKTIFGNHYVAIFLFYAVVGVSLKIAAIYKYSIFPYLSLLIYFPSYFFLHDMTQIRIGLAGGICLLGIRHLFSGDKRKWIAYCLFATLLHYSSLLLVVMVLINKDAFSKKKYLVILLICFLVSFFRIDFIQLFSHLPLGAISLKLQQYSSIKEVVEASRANIFSVLFLTKLFLGLILLLISSPSNSKEIVLIKIYIISLCSFSFFSSSAMLAFRVSELFGLVECISLTYLVKYSRFRFVPFLMILILVIFYFVFALYIERNIQEYHIVV